MHFRHFAVATMLAWCSTGMANDYPNRPVTVIVNQAAGGGTDAIARAASEELGKRLGQAFVVENRPGGSGALGFLALARAKPDGYTISISATTPMTYGRYTMTSLPFDPQRDFAYIALLSTIQFVVAVNKDVPAANMKEFLDWAKNNKGKVSYGSYAAGSLGHLICAYLSNTLGLDMTHVPYKGEAPMTQDLVGGQVAWGIASKGTLAPFLANGRLRALAVIGSRRLPELPDLPTMAEIGFPGPEFLPLGGFGVLAPAGAPQAVLDQLEKASLEVARSPKLLSLYQTYGMSLIGNGSSEFRKEIEASWPTIESLVRISGYKPGD